MSRYSRYPDSDAQSGRGRSDHGVDIPGRHHSHRGHGGDRRSSRAGHDSRGYGDHSTRPARSRWDDGSSPPSHPHSPRSLDTIDEEPMGLRDTTPPPPSYTPPARYGFRDGALRSRSPSPLDHRYGRRQDDDDSQGWSDDDDSQDWSDDDDSQDWSDDDDSKGWSDDESPRFDDEDDWHSHRSEQPDAGFDTPRRRYEDSSYGGRASGHSGYDYWAYAYSGYGGAWASAYSGHRRR